MKTHDVIDPAIFYFGTPVALLSTVDPDGRPNLAPMSSVFWLGRRAVIGMSERLALTTGREQLSARKASVGYRFEPDKFGHARLTPIPSDLVRPFRVAECPVNLETRLVMDHDEELNDHAVKPMELEIVRTHVHPTIRSEAGTHRIDPDWWRPLIMSFQRFYGVGYELHPSRLATIAEEWYR